MDMLTTLTPYHWLVLGLLLLGAEALGAAGFLIGAAVAGLATGAIVGFAPGLGAGAQIALFAVLALVLTYLYLKLFRDAQTNSERPLLNQRATRLIGHRFKLDSDVRFGEGRVQIGDTMWKVTADADLPEGADVEVVDVHRMTLTLAPLANPNGKASHT